MKSCVRKSVGLGVGVPDNYRDAKARGTQRFTLR
jgi:hypothetical protein